MEQLVYRFLVGGLIVSVFAVIGDVLKPKSFAGLFGSAPSVALATLSLAIFWDGKTYAAIEGRSMIAGAVAFCFYSCLCMRLMKKKNMRAAQATIPALAIWLALAVSAWVLILR